MIYASSLLALLSAATFASAASQPLTSVADMTKIIPGTGSQPVTAITDEQLELWANKLLPTGSVINLPGWSDATHQTPIAEQVIKAFAVRTPPATKLEGESIFHISVGVGRSGILEKNQRGDAFAIINGIPLKGLTIKGYGGNTAVPAYASRQQPGGSLSLDEGYRDALMSSVLLDANVDTYVGILSVGRNGKNANFIRLSRTALRMNDLVDRNGDDVKAVVDHLTNVLQDEVGKKMSPQEFAHWLVDHTAQVLARKERLGYRHGSQDDSNIGIAELVDHGEGSYQPFDYKPEMSATQLSKFRQFTLQAADKIATAYGLGERFESRFDHAYALELNKLVENDSTRLVLDTARVESLRSQGLSAEAVALVQRAQSSPYGVMGLDELMDHASISKSDREIFKSRTMTTLQQAPNGSLIPTVLVRELGGSALIRSAVLLASQRLVRSGISFQDQASVEKTVQQALIETLKKNGRQAVVDLATKKPTYGTTIYGSMPIENIAKKVSLLIKADFDAGLPRFNYNLREGGRLLCREIFAPAAL